MNFFKKALIAILSVGLVTVPATREVETVEAADMKCIYFKPDTGTWNKDGARFALYYWVGTSNGWKSMTKVNTNYFYCEFDTSWTGYKFVRMNGANSNNDWGNKWNESGNLSVTKMATNNCLTKANDWWDTWTESSPNITLSTYNAYKLSLYDGDELKATKGLDPIRNNVALDVLSNTETHTFLGWSTTKGASTVEYTSTYSIDATKNVALYAVWEEIQVEPEGPTEEELNEAKEEAIYALNNYKDYSGYNDEVKASIQNIISAAESEINAATSLSDISTILANAKNDIDGIVELEDSKISAIESLNAIDYVKYSEENQNSIKAIVNEAITKINNATSVDEVITALDEANTKISNIKTVEQEFDELHKDDYLLLGSFNGWNTKDTTYAFTKVGARYESTVTLEKGATIKACKYSGSNWLGYHDSMSTAMKTLFDKDDDGNLVVKNGGTYTFVLKDLNSPDYKDFYVEGIEDNWGLIGIDNDWDNDIQLEYNGNTLRYEAFVEVKTKCEYKFRLDGKWDYNIGTTGVGGSNFSINPGKYVFYINDNNVSINSNPHKEVGYTIAFDAKAELAFGYEYNENGDITAVNNMKARFGTDYVALSSYNGLNISDYGIRLDKGDKMTDKPYTKTWKYSSDLAEDNIVGKFTYNEETSQYTEDSENPTHIRWILTIKDIPTTYYNGNFTYECFIVVDGVEYTVSNRRTVSVVSLAETYAGMDSIAEGHKKACQYIVETYKVVEA